MHNASYSLFIYYMSTKVEEIYQNHKTTIISSPRAVSVREKEEASKKNHCYGNSRHVLFRTSASNVCVSLFRREIPFKIRIRANERVSRARCVAARGRVAFAVAVAAVSRSSQTIEVEASKCGRSRAEPAPTPAEHPQTSPPSSETSPIEESPKLRRN